MKGLGGCSRDGIVGDIEEQAVLFCYRGIVLVVVDGLTRCNGINAFGPVGECAFGVQHFIEELKRVFFVLFCSPPCWLCGRPLLELDIYSSVKQVRAS